LGDTASLTGGAFPPGGGGGTISFTLFAPPAPGAGLCSGTVVFTGGATNNPVNANGLYFAPTVPTASITQVGTYQWVASYSGDANNNAVSTNCGDEPVVITKPVISVVKTPKGTQYHAGDTISFSVVVTNNGPGTATNVHLAPPDSLPDPNASLNWSVSQQPAQGTCNVSGAAGSQLLTCDFGNITQGTSLTVTVSTATQASDLGDCGTPLTLNNSATVVADNADPKTDTGSQFCQRVGPTLPTTPIPATGKVGGPALNDSAQLTGGFSPFAGTITFNLFDPTQTNCSGAPVGRALAQHVRYVAVDGALQRGREQQPGRQRVRGGARDHPAARAHHHEDAWGADVHTGADDHLRDRGHQHRAGHGVERALCPAGRLAGSQREP
jgi:uncharacterized repeat protein (TIGR01451 family)